MSLSYHDGYAALESTSGCNSGFHLLNGGSQIRNACSWSAVYTDGNRKPVFFHLNIKFDYQTLYRFTDDHLDAPAAVVLLLRAMQHLGTTHWETWDSSHGAILKENSTLQSTSYVVGVFR